VNETDTKKVFNEVELCIVVKTTFFLSNKGKNIIHNEENKKQNYIYCRLVKDFVSTNFIWLK